MKSVSTLQFFIQDSKRRTDVLEKLEWALGTLQKEDRVLWVLGIVRRYHLLTWNPTRQARALPRNDKKKRSFTLREFGLDRITEDYDQLVKSFIPNWLHFKSLTEIHGSHTLRKLPFNRMQDGRQIPLGVNELTLRLRSQEEALAKNSLSKFCDDGSDFLSLENGWKWVRVEEGYSRQEASAMGHCGNGAGKLGDVLYSLREPIRKKGKRLWRPHLTFICNKSGFFGEMKGRANGKPAPIYNEFATQLFTQSEFRGVRGGGYRPENNFDISELSSRQIAQIVVENPRFDMNDFLCKEAESIHNFGDGWDLAFYQGIEKPNRPRKSYKIEDSVPMYLFRRRVKVGSAMVLLPGLALPFVQGYLGEPLLKRSVEIIPAISEKFKTLLKLVEVQGVSAGSILRPNCPWFELLGITSPNELVFKFPHFASATPVNELASRFGTGPHLVNALSLKLGHEVAQEKSKEWRLLRLRSLSLFLKSVMDFPTLRALKAFKEGNWTPALRQELKRNLLSRVKNFHFGHSEIQVVLERPDSLGSPCYITTTDTGLARICSDIGTSEASDSQSFIEYLVRTYDYNRATFKSSPDHSHPLNLAA